MVDAPGGGALEDNDDAWAGELLDNLTLHEKLRLVATDVSPRGLPGLLGPLRRRPDHPPPVAGALPRLSIPGVRVTDGRSDAAVGGATAFPAPLARAASFDPELEERIGAALGDECRASGANLFAGVCVDLLRHPAWRRAQETFGEDPCLVGEMAAALVRGVQRHTMACVGHLASQPMESDRDRIDVRVDPDDLRDVDLPPLRRVVAEGVAAVTTGAHRLNGEPCAHHRHLVTDVLKGEWGFDGFVVSGAMAGPHPADAAIAGTDLQMPSRQGFRRLVRLVRAGRVPPERVDDATRRILRQQLRFEDGKGRRGGHSRPENAALAQEAAERSLVLLRNYGVLPLDATSVRTLALFGRLAALPAGGGLPTILDALRAVGERHVIDVHHQAGDDLDAAGLAAASADAAVVVVGDVPADRDLTFARRRRPVSHDLTLRPEDERLIRTVAAANRRTAIVLVSGSAVVTESWREQVGAILAAWLPGEGGGQAVARALFGDVNPGGRLPCTWPRSAEQLPRFDPAAARVHHGPRHGYRLMQATDRSPAFPFGFGLSYTTFEHGRLTRRRAWDGSITVTVPVTNIGTRVGDEVVQLYLDEPLGSDPRPLRTLRAFRRVTVAPGGTVDVTLPVRPEATLRAQAANGGVLVGHVGRSADPRDQRAIEI